MLVDPGPAVMRGDAARGARRRAPAGAAADPHPLRPRGRGGRAGAPLAGPAGLRARARRAAHGRPGAARRQRRAAVRRRGGPARAVGRGRPGARRRTCACSSGGETRRRGRVPGRVHARPRLPPRLLPPRGRRAGRSSATWPACGSRRTTSRSRRRRRPTSTSRRGSARSTRSPPGSPTALGAHALRPGRRPAGPARARAATRCTGRSSSPAEHDQDGFVAAMDERVARARPARRSTRSIQAAPLDQLYLGLDRWHSKQPGQVS